MPYKSIDASPQGYARLAGAIYLLVIVFGGFSEGYVANTLVVSGDMAATARHISASPGLWRISVAGDLIVPMIAIIQLWIEYSLVRPVSRSGALLFLLFNAASLAVEAVSKVFLLMVAPTLQGLGYASGLDGRQALALAGFALTAHDIAFNITLILFGFACLVIGSLIFRSGYLPRVIGALMQIAGVCYLMASCGELFAPALIDRITPFVLLPALIGEASFCLWLLIKGVNVARWRERLVSGPTFRAVTL